MSYSVRIGFVMSAVATGFLWFASAGSCFGADAPAKSAKASQTQAKIELLTAEAVKSYKAGKLSDAVSQLQQAITAIQKEMEKGLAAMFPPAPKGWEAGEIDKGSAAMASAQSTSWTNVSRTYTRKSDQVTAEISLTNSPQLMAGQKQMVEMYKNPQLLAMVNRSGQTKITPLSREGWSGLTIVSKEDDTAKAIAFSGGGNLVDIEISKADAQILEMFLKAVNFKAVPAATKPAAKPAGK